MPFQIGSVAVHDDGQHFGSSKRDTVDGVAGLDSSGFLLAKGAGIQFPRDGSNDVHIYERTSGEEAYAFHRTGPDDYTFYIKESNVWRRFQTETMKDTANGIAGLDAGQKIGGSAVPGLFNKYLIGDADLHTHNTEEGTGNTSYTMMKQMLLSALHPTPSTIRVRFQLKALAGGETVYGKIYKGVNPVGTERSTNSDTPITFDEDISFAQGDALRIYAKTAAGIDTAVINDFVIRGTKHQLTFQEALDDSHAGLLNPVVVVNS